MPWCPVFTRRLPPETGWRRYRRLTGAELVTAIADAASVTLVRAACIFLLFYIDIHAWITFSPSAGHPAPGRAGFCMQCPQLHG